MLLLLFNRFPRPTRAMSEGIGLAAVFPSGGMATVIASGQTATTLLSVNGPTGATVLANGQGKAVVI